MMRQSAPVYRDPNRQNWSVFSYNDVQRVLSEHSTFSSQFNDSGQVLDASIISMDPPRHRQLRSLVTLAFTPRTIARLTTRITEIVNELLDKVTPQGQMDVINDLSYPLPVIVIAELLGIPHEDRARFKLWSDQFVGAAPSYGKDPQVEMGDYFKWVIAQRRKEPKDDLISALLAAQIDGKHLTEQELLGFCVLLLVAGNETTTHLIGNAIWCLDDYPQAMAELRADHSPLPDAIEEVLRYRSPVPGVEVIGLLTHAGHAYRRKTHFGRVRRHSLDRFSRPRRSPVPQRRDIRYPPLTQSPSGLWSRHPLLSRRTPRSPGIQNRPGHHA